MRHGADSPRMVAPLAAEFERQLPAVAPWTARPSFAGARAALAYAEAQTLLLRQYLDTNGLVDSDGEPRPALERLDRIEARAAKLREALGLTPMSLSRLLVNLSAVAAAGGDEDGLEALKREGAEIVAARQLLVVDDQVEGDPGE